MFFRKKKEQLPKSEQTATDFINFRDIKDNFFYTNDGYIHLYIKVDPISLDLMKMNDIRAKARGLSAMNLNMQFKFFSIPRPKDISHLISFYANRMNMTFDPVARDILKNETSEISQDAQSGEIVEIEFYYMLWDKYREGVEQELLKKGRNFKKLLNDNNVKAAILIQSEIVTLANLINNPAYVLEGFDTELSFTNIVDLFGAGQGEENV